MHFEITDGPTHGVLQFNESRYSLDTEVTYKPEANYFGSDSFTYLLNDGTDDSGNITVSITIISVNDAPVADGQALYVDEDTRLAITLTASEPENESGVLTYSIIDSTANGLLSGTPPNLSYDPAANFFGGDILVFAATDDDGAADTTSVFIAVNSISDPPNAFDEEFTVNEDDTLMADVRVHDADPNDEMEFEIVTGPLHGQAFLEPYSIVDDEYIAPLSYIPELNFFGRDTLVFVAIDLAGLSTSAVVIIIVDPVNDPPIADSAISASVAEDDTVRIVLAATDVDNDEFTFAIETLPTNGSFVPPVLSEGDSVLFYVPNANYNGLDSFTFIANDHAFLHFTFNQNKGVDMDPTVVLHLKLLNLNGGRIG